MPKITELNELSSAFSGCKIPIVDPNDPTQGASGTTKYINWQNLSKYPENIKSFDDVQKSGVSFVHSTSPDEGTALAVHTGFVFDSGNVRLGIGVENPQATLHVGGDVIAQNISGEKLQIDNLSVDNGSVVVSNKLYVSGVNAVPDLYIVSTSEGIGDPSIKFAGADQINNDYRWRLGVGSSVVGADFSINQYGKAEMFAVGLGNLSNRYGIWSHRGSFCPGNKGLAPVGFSLFTRDEPVALFLKSSTPATGSMYSGQMSFSFDSDGNKLESWINKDGSEILSGYILHDYSFAGGEITGRYEDLKVDKILSQKIGNVDLGVLGSGSITLDLASGDFFYGIQTGNLTIDITGVSTSINNVELDLLMSGAGSYTISLPASFQSLAATAPTIYSTTGQHNIFVAQTTDSGVNWQYALAGGSA